MPELGSLVYLRDKPQASGADKYHGAVASGYDAKREDSPKWKAEQAIIEDMLSDLPATTEIFDIPVGTGRFIPFYAQRQFKVWGFDKSEDMIRQAMQKAWSVGADASFSVADVRDLSFIERAVDASVMCRLTRWLMEDENCKGRRVETEVPKAMAELARVTRKRIIVTLRPRNHPFACPYELITVPGWRIVRDEAGMDNTGAVDEDYRIVAMEPV